MERHARWIADSGAGAIDVSWWGPDSNVNEVIPQLMDVMRAHDIHVTFYVEPYVENHAENYARDLLYLIKNYGDRRHWDCFLLHEHEDGTVGPVFKSFRTILLPTATDCHGVTSPVADYATDDVWRRQTDAIRELLRERFRLPDASGRFHPGGAHAGRRFRRHRALRQLRVARHLAPARRELHGPQSGLLVSGQSGIRQHRVPSPRAGHVLRAAGVRARRRRLRLDARIGSCGRPKAPAGAGSRTRSTRRSASRPRPRWPTSSRGSFPSTSTRSTNGTRAISSSR